MSDVALDLNKIFDDNITSCIPTLNLLGSKDMYSGKIYFSKYNSTMDQESIGLNVTFDGMVNCGLRKVNKDRVQYQRGHTDHERNI